ncbi:MAG: TetR/AcrR family transcriptional regulator [Nitrospira sp.]|nr:TetR/AcrR family transcriptional regulator [Nitrospira sp.]MBH0181787.1 TetR/AcrR family transcriptional regulator [Nitrospira sp.]MBH0184518.1 TetR/AcrR family transcriptional regulator [Nitrospira sp.]
MKQATKSSQRPSRTSGPERQAGLINAAASLFAANGFQGTTTKAIAKAAGVSEALLFKYFPTKRVLYAAILAEKAQYSELRDAVEEAARKHDDTRLFTLLASYRIKKGADPTMLRLLLFSALEGHELSDMFFQRQYRAFHDLLAHYISKRIESGAFRPVDPLLAARAFFGIIVHHRLLHDILGLPMHRTYEDTIEEYVSLFLGGLIQPSPALSPHARV